MEIFFEIGAVVFGFVSAIILPWVNRAKVKELDREVKHLTAALQNEGIKIQRTQPFQYSSPAASTPALEEQQNSNEDDLKDTDEPETEIEPKTESQPEPVVKVGFEQQFGARLPVWIGGIALALAGFFLVKYSIDNNLLRPSVRVTLGGLLGIALLYSAKWVRGKPDFANGVRIAQSLAGAGIAVLYVISFASARLYELIPMFAGFAAMAAVTATALVLSLRHGPPIAVLGMMGGFLTPALLDTGGGTAFSLFIYLYFTASGLLIVVRKTDWWWLSIPTIAASILWVIVWLFSSYHPGDSIWLGLFLLGISATIVISSRQQYEEDGGGTSAGVFKLTSILNYIGLGGALIVMGVIAEKTGLGFMEWGLFGLLAAGGLGLAYFNDKLYGFVPWISMAVTAVILFTWKAPDHAQFALTLAIFAIAYTGCGYHLMFRARLPILWAGLAGATSLSYYSIALFKLRFFTLLSGIPFFWGLSALILATGSIYALFKMQNRFSDYEYRERLNTVLSITATSFITLALFVELGREFLPIAIAGEMLVIAWINNKVDIKALRPIIGVLACIFGLLLLPQIILMIQLTMYSLVEAKLRLQASVPLINWPLFQLGLPALMFIGSSYLLRQHKDNRLVQFLEIAAITLVAVMGYYITRNSLHPGQNVLFLKADFFERGVITNILLIYGLACFSVGRKFERTAFFGSGFVLFGIAVFRIIYFDMLIHNPVLDSQKIEGIAILNSLLLPYGLPLVWVYIARKELKNFGLEEWAGYARGFMFASAFVLITMNVRHIFHGEFLNTGITSNAEIYTYSAVWLLLGIGLLFGGVLKHDKMLRYASLGVILLTVGKVFLYDASELEGLYRVFSFFGLGVCLIGLSYFYTRFVFGESKP